MYKKLTSCVCCGSVNLFQILDLGEQPLANNFHDNTKSLPTFELKLMGCPSCFHTQLSIAIDPEILFKNYLYVSGTSHTLKEYFDETAERYDKQIKGKKVLDIACNDGSQLDSFKKLGWTTYGVDPATNLYPISTNKGHFVLNSFWNYEIASKMPKMPLIIAQNVLAHTSDPGTFLKLCAMAMDSNTKLIIQTSQADMFNNNEFDTIYHEHISFFNILSMQKLANNAGLFLNNHLKTPIHGNSYVFELGKDNNQSEETEKFISEQSKLISKKTYERYALNVDNCVVDLFAGIKKLEKTGFKMIGYGAAAKGMTVLNYTNIKLDYIVDDNPLKQGLYCPGSNIPVYSSDVLVEEEKPLIIVPLAWNFFDEIKNRIKGHRPDKKDLFVRYFPKFQISM